MGRCAQISGNKGGQQIIRKTVINVLGYSCTTPTQSSLQGHDACKQSSRRALPATVYLGQTA